MLKLKNLLAATAMSMVFIASASFTEASSASPLDAGQKCADELYSAVREKSPEQLLRSMDTLVNVDQVIAKAARVNGDTLTPDVLAKYKEGMADFAEHFVIPNLVKELQRRAPQITAVTANGKTLIISDGKGASLTVERKSCRILNANGSGVSLIGMFSKHVKANFS